MLQTLHKLRGTILIIIVRATIIKPRASCPPKVTGPTKVEEEVTNKVPTYDTIRTQGSEVVTLVEWIGKVKGGLNLVPLFE